MSKKGGSAPAAPDPAATAAAQTSSNIDTAIANSYMGNANQSSPFGTVSYDQTGTQNVNGHDVPTFTTTTSLSPDEQKLWDNQMALGNQTDQLALGQAGRIGSIVNSPVQLKSIQDELGGSNLDQLQSVAQNAIMQRMQPQLDQGRQSLEAELVNQGMTRGTTAFNNAMNESNQQANDAQLGAITAAQGYASNLFNQAAQQASSDNQNTLTERTEPINEIGALMGLGQVTVPQASQFQAGQVAGTPVGQYAYQSYQGNLDAWKTQQQANAQSMGGLFGLGGSILGAAIKSDRRLKRDIRSLGIRLPLGLPLYVYRYLDDDAEHVGVMADEVEGVMPAAVVTMSDGFKAVHYGMLV